MAFEEIGLETAGRLSKEFPFDFIHVNLRVAGQKMYALPIRHYSKIGEWLVSGQRAAADITAAKELGRVEVESASGGRFVIGRAAGLCRSAVVRRARQ